MSSMFGNTVKISIFGQSHSQNIGVVIDGIPAGHKIDLEEVALFMRRRAPGNDTVSTKRKETDEPHILSGLVDGITCGAPLCAVFDNANTHSSDYDSLKDIPRPAHSDYPAFVKHHGFNDIRGGGHFSGRLTAPLCFAGAVCIQLLREKHIHVGAHILEIGGIRDNSFDSVNITEKDFQKIHDSPKPLLNQSVWTKMEEQVLLALKEQDSVGGIIECAVTGLPVGLGNPMFDGVENRISAAIFAVPAVKGIEFGNGFACAGLRGSQNNDEFYYDGDVVKTRTNNHGGILGGLTSGMPLVFRTAFKPTPSIAKEQDSVSLSKKIDTKLNIKGRHDPCVVLRAVPCIESAAAIALYDLLLGDKNE